MKVRRGSTLVTSLMPTNWSFIIGMAMLCLSLSACQKAPPSPQAVQKSRLEWNLKTLVGAYEENGNTDASWDEAATNALIEFARARSSMLGDDEDSWGEIVATNAAKAVHAGCDDPMIAYLFIKFAMSQTNSRDAFGEAFKKAADEIQESAYPDIRKFYVCLRTAEQLKYAAHDSSHTPLEVHEYRRLAMTNLADALGDKSLPAGEADDACHEMLNVLYRNQNQKQYGDCYRLIKPPLLKNWPDESFAWLIQGEAHIEMAWFARGGGYANQVAPEKWKLFADNLAEADTELKKAWKLDPTDVRIPIQMMRVIEGQEKKLDELDLWFHRAMAIDPNSSEACERKLHYLYPQWYGSREAMLEFGRECVATTNWGGQVPLTLVNAHWEYWSYLGNSSEKTNYWKLPDVWPDIEAAFDRFLELNPDATGYYYTYAWYAYRAEQWDKLNELIPKLKPVDYAYFGGKDAFDKMVELVRQHVSKTR